MAMVQECVSAQQLRDYLLGRLDDHESERLETHLRDCAACDETAARLEADDTLARHLRSVADGDPPPSDEGFAASAERVKKMAPLLNQTSLAASGEDGVSEPCDAEVPLGGYELLERIGVGGMGAVYRGRHQRLDRIVAIKLLPSRVARDPAAIARFQREMRAAGRLDHPAIVAATDAGEHGGTHFLVMELVDGLDLARIARSIGPLPICEACELIRQAAIGLDYAHSRGVVHRDVKPSNLMLDRQGRVKILDLGLAQLGPWQQPVDEGTTVGQLMGTLDYMAPEQAESGQPTDYRADLYSLGATLFRLLCGRAPYAVTPHLSPLEKLRLLATSEPPKLATLRPDAPPELCRLIDQLLSRSPADRPGSAAVVAERLQPLCDGAATAALLDRARERLADQPTEEPSYDADVVAAAAAIAAAERGNAGNGRRRWKAWVGAAAMLPLLLLAGIVVVLETNKGQVVIESEAADVQVRLLRYGEAVDEFTVHQGASATRVRAGKYEVVIDGPSDQLTVDDNTFTLRRGETVVTRITRRRPAVAAAEPSARVVELPLVTELIREQYELQMLRRRLGNDHPSVVEQQHRIEAIEKMLAATEAAAAPAPAGPTGPTYEGKTLDEWLAVLDRERAPQEVAAALRALRALANRESAEKVTTVVLRVARQLSEDYFSTKDTVFPILQKLNAPQTVMEHVLEQLSVDDPTWQRRILDGLGTLVDLREYPESLDPLVKQVAPLAIDSQNQELSYAALRQLLNIGIWQQVRGDSTEKVREAWDHAMAESPAVEGFFAEIVLEPTWPEWVQQSFLRWSAEQIAKEEVTDEVLIRAAVNISANVPLAVETYPDLPQTIADQLGRRVDPLPTADKGVLVQAPFANPAAQLLAATILGEEIRAKARIQITPTLLLASLAAQPLLRREDADRVLRKFLQQPGSDPIVEARERVRLLDNVLSGKNFFQLVVDGKSVMADSVEATLNAIALAVLGDPAEGEGREARDIEPKETPR